MQCIILAGGYGTRLKPLTYTRQKVLLPVMNQPMIMHIIDALPKEVDRVILAANYKKEQIIDYFRKHDTGREIIVNPEPAPLGTAGAVKHAARYINSDFMVVNSDIVSSCNISEMVSQHKKSKAFVTISLWPVENVREFGVVSLETDGRITKFVEKPRPEEAPSNLINSGHYMLDYRILDLIESGKMVSMEKEIFPRIITDTDRFYGYRFTGYWIDVGKISNYLLAHRMIMDNLRISHLEGKDCKISGELVYSSIGNGVTVAEGSVLTGSVAMDNSQIGSGAIITNSVIGEDCKIGDGAHLTDCVIGDGHNIAQGTTIKGASVWQKEIPEGYPSGQIGNVIGPG